MMQPGNSSSCAESTAWTKTRAKVHGKAATLRDLEYTQA